MNLKLTMVEMSGLFERSRVILPIIFPMSVVLASCGGSRTDGGGLYMKRVGWTATDLDKDVGALKPQFVVEEGDGGGLYLGMTASAGGAEDSPQMRALNSIQSVSFIAFDSDGNLLDSLRTDRIIRSGLGGPESSLAASAGVTWNPASPIPQKLHLVMVIRSSSGVWPKEVLTSFDAPLYSEPIVLDLDYAPRGKGLEFVLTARRVTETKGEEYLPSAEMYRIELFNGPTRLWSSSGGKAFAQVIGPVDPDEIGEKIEYRAVWNGTDATGAPARSGALTVVATIPAKPNPYTLRKEIEWTAR